MSLIDAVTQLRETGWRSGLSNRILSLRLP